MKNEAAILYFQKLICYLKPADSEIYLLSDIS